MHWTVDRISQEFDEGGDGVRCDRILKLKVLGYADDAVLIDEAVDNMTGRLTSIADASEAHADMKVNMTKTFTQYVFVSNREDITVTMAEAAAAEAGFEFKYDFCPRRFKTQRHMHIHI